MILPPLITTVPFGMSAPLTVTTVPPRIAKVPCGPGFGLNDPSWAYADAGSAARHATAIHRARMPFLCLNALITNPPSSRNHGTAAAIGGLERGAFLRHPIAHRGVLLLVEEHFSVDERR